MFLDDQLLEIGRKAKMTERGLITATRNMLQACVDNGYGYEAFLFTKLKN